MFGIGFWGVGGVGTKNTISSFALAQRFHVSYNTPKTEYQAMPIKEHC